MRFTPKTEEEIQSENLIPAGEYDFEILTAEEKTSKAGNDMIALKVKIFTDDNERTVFDYLMESIGYKLRHAAEACGLVESYNKGVLEADDFVGKVGRCKVGIQKDKSGQYPDKNSISDYLIDAPNGPEPAKVPFRQRQPAMAGGHIDDDIPFAWIAAILVPALSALLAVGGVA